MRGSLFVISAPSGCGKTTIIKELLKKVPDITLAVSATTRQKRDPEIEGVDYHFISQAEFKKLISSGGFLEWAEVHGELYGTPKKDVEGFLVKGIDVLLDIDVQGATEVRKKYPSAVSIFVLPPSFAELEERLKKRGANTKEEMEKRLTNAREEYVRRHEYDYQVVNDDLEEAVQEVREIIDFHRSGK